MRMVLMGAAALALVACGKSEEEEAAERADLGNYTPPFVMSRLDFGGVIERRFRRLDRNADDRLVPSELAARNRDRLMRFDTDGDGTIGPEEWSVGMLARFDRQDMNHDGTVTSDERVREREQEDELPTPADEPTGAVGNAR